MNDLSKCSLRHKISAWTAAELLDEMILRHNRLLPYQREPFGMDPFDQDMLAACYAEILHRMGKSKKKIKKDLQKHPLLLYRYEEDSSFLWAVNKGGIPDEG